MKIEKYKDPSTGRWKFKTDFTCANVRHYPVADSKDELADIIDAIRKRARQEKYGLVVEEAVITISELVAARVADLDMSNGNHRTIKRVFESFRDCIGAATPVRSIKKAHLKRFVSFRRSQNPNLRPYSINFELNRLNTLFRQADTYFSELEDWKSPRMPFEALPQGSERVIEDDEQAKLLFELRAPAGGLVGEKRPRRERPEEFKARNTVADLFEFALLTGLRNTEARTLQKPQVDWTIKTYADDLTVYGELSITGKGSKKRKVPLNRDARELLERKLSEDNCEWFFPNGDGTGPISKTVVYQILRRKARKAKVSYGRYTEGGFVFHHTRHTAATGMLQGSSYDLKTVGDILGHSDETMTMHYAHPTAARRASAISGLKKSSNGTMPDKKSVEDEG
jgi:integrase